MQFLIADTFSDSLGRLTGDEQKAAKTTAFDLQVNPASPGLQFHRLAKARDKNFWSVRVNGDIRVIVHRSHASLLLCYVDHHDKAYVWAERRRLETHPRTGAAQFVEIETTTKVIRQPGVAAPFDSESAPPGQATHPLATLSNEEMEAVGVPPSRFEELRAATGMTLEAAVETLPPAASSALLDYATGGTLQPAAPQAIVAPKALTHPEARRHFRIVMSREGLERLLDEAWATVTAELSVDTAIAGAAGRVAAARNVAERAERLFAWLLENNRLVTYATAFELLFQQSATPFRNGVHVPPVLEIAQRTPPRVYDGLELRLDSLVVGKATARPGEGHFRTAPYTPDQWGATFRLWPLV